MKLTLYSVACPKCGFLFESPYTGPVGAIEFCGFCIGIPEVFRRCNDIVYFSCPECKASFKVNLAMTPRRELEDEVEREEEIWKN